MLCVCVRARVRLDACVRVEETEAIFVSQTISLTSRAQTRTWYAPCNFIISCSPLSLLLFHSEVKWNATEIKHLFQTIHYKKDTRQVFVSTDSIFGFI
jgi:hypothetical protein